MIASMAHKPKPYNSSRAVVNRLKREGVKMLSSIRMLAFCTIAGSLLAVIFLTPEGPAAGAVKGFLVGALLVWGDWKSRDKATLVRWIHHGE
jgi:membrane associated rhomboid family serine protease